MIVNLTSFILRIVWWNNIISRGFPPCKRLVLQLYIDTHTHTSPANCYSGLDIFSSYDMSSQNGLTWFGLNDRERESEGGLLYSTIGILGEANKTIFPLLSSSHVSINFVSYNNRVCHFSRKPARHPWVTCVKNRNSLRNAHDHRRCRRLRIEWYTKWLDGCDSKKNPFESYVKVRNIEGSWIRNIALFPPPVPLFSQPFFLKA